MFSIIRKKLKMNNGISLIEVITVIAIILILTAAVAVMPDKRGAELDNAARQLVSDLRRAQNMSMSAVEQSSGVPCGYGIYFDASDVTTYIAFADVVSSCDKDYDAGTDMIIGGSPIDLPSGVTISNGSDFNIFFETPSGAATINSDPFDIDLQASGATKKVTITSTGKIEISN